MRPTIRQRIFDFSRLAFWIGLVATMYVCAALINISAKNTSLREKSDHLEESIITLEAQVQDLEAQKAYYQTEAYQERLAREKLGLQNPGEQVVITGQGDAERKVQSAATTADVSLPKQSHIEEWLQFLFGSEPT